MIEITSRCNLSCIHCVWKVKNKYGDMGTDMMNSSLKKVSVWKPKEIVILGGEPLLRKDILQILENLRKYYSGTIYLSTNAILINENNVGNLSILIDKFDISIDGYNEKTCSKIRGKGVFKKVIRGIELLKENGSNNIYLSFVIGDKYNIEYLKNSMIFVTI